MTSLLHFTISQNNGDFCQICSDLGFRVKEDKNEDGHCIRFLGVDIDTEVMGACLPHLELKKATALINSTLAQHSVIHRSLETTAAFLACPSNVVPASCPFLRPLNDSLMANSSPHHIPIWWEIKKELPWWQTCLPQWNRTRLLHHPQQILQVWTDASGQTGIGGYFLRPG